MDQQGMSTPFSRAEEFVLWENHITDAEVFYKPEKFPATTGTISTMARDKIFKALSSHTSKKWVLLVFAAKTDEEGWEKLWGVNRIYAAFSKQNSANFLVCKQSFLLDLARFYL